VWHFWFLFPFFFFYYLVFFFFLSFILFYLVLKNNRGVLYIFNNAMAEIIPLKADRDNARDVMMCFLCTIFFFFLNHQPFSSSYIISFLLYFIYIYTLYPFAICIYCRYSWFRLLLVGIALFPFLYHASLNLVGGFLFLHIFFTLTYIICFFWVFF
jgi:hypothetical protein